METKKETPWAVLCHIHGQVFLDKVEYLRQMNQPNQLWHCPKCGETADWDDDNFEKHTYKDEYDDDDDDIPF